MRNIEDNLLKYAEQYQESLENEHNESSPEEVRDLFKSIFNDYKKMLKKCKKQGIDIDNDIEEYEVLLEDGSCKEQIDAVENVQDKIINMMDLCDNVPQSLESKYRKDVVDLIK